MGVYQLESAAPLVNVFRTPSPSVGGGASAPATLSPNDQAIRDVDENASCKKGGFGSIGLWEVRLTNKSKTTTYQNLLYRTIYESESGSRLKTNRAQFQIVLKPGETRRLADFNDGFIPQQTTRCGLALIGGEVHSIAPAASRPTPKPSK